MSDNPWSNHPIIGAAALAAATALLAVNGYYLIDGVPDTPQHLAKLQLKLAAGLVLWTAACGIISRTRHSTWKRGLLLGLLSVPGLLVLLLTTGGKTRQEIWEAANPELAGDARRRQYRDMKPLY